MKLIYLEWADAHYNNGWKSVSESLEWCKSSDWIIKEAGWLVKENNKYLVFATALKPENEYEEAQFLNLHKIPKTWILKRKIINTK